MKTCGVASVPSSALGSPFGLQPSSFDLQPPTRASCRSLCLIRLGGLSAPHHWQTVSAKSGPLTEGIQPQAISCTQLQYRTSSTLNITVLLDSTLVRNSQARLPPLRRLVAQAIQCAHVVLLLGLRAATKAPLLCSLAPPQDNSTFTDCRLCCRSLRFALECALMGAGTAER